MIFIEKSRALAVMESYSAGKSMKFTIKRIFAILILAVIAGIILFPWKTLLGTKLSHLLEARGFENVHLTISSLGWNSVSLKDITVGAQTPLTLNNINIGYSPSDIWHGSLQDLTLQGLKLEAVQQNGHWMVSGLEHFFHSEEPADSAARIPVSDDELAALSFNKAVLENSNLHVASPAGEGDIPLDITLVRAPDPLLRYEAPSLYYKTPDMKITTGNAKLEAHLNVKEKIWQGSWSIKNIALENAAFTIPVLEGSGTLIAKSDAVAMEGNFHNADNGYKAAFKIDYSLAQPDKSKLTVTDASMPWNKGTLSLNNAIIGLAGGKSTSLTLKVQGVSIDALMQSLTGNRATATGTVTGSLPVVLGADGSLLIQQGKITVRKARYHCHGTRRYSR